MDILNVLLTQLHTLALSSLKCLTSLIIFIISLRNKMASSLRVSKKNFLKSVMINA